MGFSLMGQRLGIVRASIFFEGEFVYNKPPPVSKDKIAFYKGEFYPVIRFDEDECRLVGNIRSDGGIEWYDRVFLYLLFFLI